MEKPRVVIVEDDGITSLDLSRSVRALGFEVAGTAVSGEQAILQATTKKPNLLLMDVKIEGKMDGISAAKKIWDDLQIPVVFVTSYSDEETLSRAKLIQPYGYILKPFEQDELRVVLELALARIAVTAELPKSTPEIEPQNKDARPELEILIGSKSLTPIEFLRRVDPFRQVSEDDLSTLAASCEFRTCPSGDRIVMEGSADPACFIVGTGRIACVKGSVSGKDLVVSLLGPGDIYGVVAGLTMSPYPFTVRVDRESCVLFLPRQPLQSLLDRNPEMYKEFGELMAERIKEADDLARRLAHDQVGVRITNALLALVGDFGQYDRETDSYQIDMTRQELAELVGTSPETAIRITKTMEKSGLLDLTKPGLIKVINLSGLESLKSQEEQPAAPQPG